MGLPTECRWESGPSQVGPVVVDIFPGKEGPQVLRVADRIFEPRSLSNEQVIVVVVNPSLKDVVVHPGQKVATVREAKVVVLTVGHDSLPIEPDRFFLGDFPMLEAWKEQLRKKLQGRINIFSLHEWDIGEAKGFEHQIQLSDPRPFHERSHHVLLAEMGEVQRHLQELLDHKIITESKSSYASSIVIVHKNNGKLRMCINYHVLNACTVVN